MAKTQGDLLKAIVEAIGADYGPLLKAAFEQQMLPKLKGNKRLDAPLSDEQFEIALAQMKPEVPHFVAWLKKQSFPVPPIEPNN